MPDQSPAESAQEARKAQLRERLKPLMHDVEITRAVQNDRPRDLYRLLRKKRNASSLADRALIDELLNSRRLFAEPIKGGPSMFTLNGIGTKLYGKQEADAQDGTFIATLFAVILYAPFYPFGQYLVAPAGGRKWFFLAKVPLNRKMWLWRRIAEGSAVAVACAIAVAVFLSKTHTTLRLVNGLDIPVDVALDNAPSVRVRATGNRSIADVSRGRHHLTTRTANGKMVEELDVDVPLAKDVVAYNVIGAAPIYAVGVQYYAHGHEPANENSSKPNEQQHYFGKRFIVRDNVQDVLVPSPKEIQMDSNRIVRWRLAVDHGGWQTTLRILAAEENDDQAATLGEQIARLEPDQEDPVAYGQYYVTQHRGTDKGLEFARALTEIAPQSLAAHRSYQTAMASADRSAECRIQYRKLAGDHPGSTEFAYLRARVELPADSVKLYADLASQKPNDANIERGYAWSLFQNRRFADALPHFEHFASLAPDAADALLFEHACALVAVGRTADALNLVGNRCEAGIRRGQLELYFLLMYGRIARLDPAAAAKRPPEQLLKQWLPEDPLKPATQAWFRYQTDPWQLTESMASSITNADLKVAIKLTAAAIHSPTEVIAQLSTAKDEVIANLDKTLIILLAGECRRQGNTQLATRLLTCEKHSAPGFVALQTNVLTGVTVPELAELDLESQAALAFTDARQTKGDEKRVQELRKRARQDDLLQGFVTSADLNWPN